MKIIKHISKLIMLFSAILIISCENEPIDSAINLDDLSCEVPTSFQASNFIDNTNVNLSWVPNGDESSWEIQYGIKGFALGTGTSVISTISNFTVSGLNAANSYSFYIRSNCSATSNSNWVGPVDVLAIDVNPNCPNPTNFTAVRSAVTNTEVNLAWTPGGTETEWEIQYSNTNFTIGSGIIITTTNPSDVITNIGTSNGFDFYMRAVCTSTQNSPWIGPVNVPAIASPTIVGTYRLTAFNTSVPTDLNGDGTNSSNQMNEVPCFDNSLLILNANGTYTADSRGVEIDLSGGYICFTDPDDAGTWVLNGNQVTFTSIDTTLPPTTFTVAGITLSTTFADGTVLTEDNGIVVELTSDITFIYTKQ